MSEPRDESAEPVYTGSGNPEVDKLIANTVQQSVKLLALLRDVATVLGLRDDSDAKTIKRLKEYVKVGMRREDHTGKR